jgi:hypothetical protein
MHPLCTAAGAAASLSCARCRQFCLTCICVHYKLRSQLIVTRDRDTDVRAMVVVRGIVCGNSGCRVSKTGPGKLRIRISAVMCASFASFATVHRCAHCAVQMMASGSIGRYPASHSLPFAGAHASHMARSMRLSMGLAAWSAALSTA